MHKKKDMVWEYYKEEYRQIAQSLNEHVKLSRPEINFLIVKAFTTSLQKY